MNSGKPIVGLVLSGGGARGAYEAGVLHYIRTMLPREIAVNRRFEVLCGSSVGAINTCIMAATMHDLSYQGRQIYDLWKNLKQEDIYLRDVLTFARFITKTIYGIGKNVFSSRKLKQHSSDGPHFSGLLNTLPLSRLLADHVHWNQISLNIRNRLLRAVSVTTTNIQNGKLELFVERHPDVPYTGHYVFHDVKLEGNHALASAAIPLIFPSVRIGRRYYMDGGVRLNTPMSPAIQFGADKVLVIGMQNIHERADVDNEEDPNSPIQAPNMGTLIGKILSAIFNDRLDYDLEQMTRINRIIEWGEGCYGLDFVPQVNEYIARRRITGDIANRGLKKLSAFGIFPSRDIRDVFYECLDSVSGLTQGLTSFERSLLKILDVDLDTGKDFLSFLLFYPPYMQRLIDLGFEDARGQHDKLVEFLS